MLLSSSGPAGSAQVEGSSRTGHGHPGPAATRQRRGDREGEVESVTKNLNTLNISFEVRH